MMAKTQQALASITLPYAAETALKRCGVAAKKVGRIDVVRPNLGHLRIVTYRTTKPRATEATVEVSIQSNSQTSSVLQCQATAKEGFLTSDSAQIALDRFLDALNDCDSSEVEAFTFPTKSAQPQNTGKWVVSALVIGAVLLFWMGGNGSDQNENANQTEIEEASLPAAQPEYNCPPDSQTTGDKFRVRGSSINIRSGPGTTFDRIVNAKATAAFGTTQYASIDSSTIVFEECRLGEWSRIYVLDPDWLRGSHRGWVANQFLISNDEFSVTGFVENDLCLDEVIEPYKEVIVAGLNKIASEDERCKNSLDPCSAYLSSTRGTPEEPVFYVTCGFDLDVVNVFFSEADLSDNRTFSAPVHIDHATAVTLCEAYAKSAANFPATVDFSWLWDLSVMDHANGRSSIRSSFSAQNAFGVEQTFDIHCLFDSNGLIEASVQEKS